MIETNSRIGRCIKITGHNERSAKMVSAYCWEKENFIYLDFISVHE